MEQIVNCEKFPGHPHLHSLHLHDQPQPQIQSTSPLSTIPTALWGMLLVFLFVFFLSSICIFYLFIRIFNEI